MNQSSVDVRTRYESSVLLWQRYLTLVSAVREKAGAIAARAAEIEASREDSEELLRQTQVI